MTADFVAASANGRITYRDTRDHFDNGLLRLLHLTEADFTRWLALSQEAPGDVVAALGRGFAELRTLPSCAPTALGHGGGPLGASGNVWHPVIAENPAFGVALAEDRSVGWLLRREGNGFARETSPPVYEEQYFEGDAGYRDYGAQAGWRLEKAARQVREVLEATGLDRAACRALDVGSGYGFFRKALGDANIAHDGVEVSAHGRRVAKESFGFDTAASLTELKPGYDLITLWDVIEHVPDPVEYFQALRKVARPGAVVALKTPNLDCPEAQVFGPFYHSLKREHLVYFTARSLERSAAAAGMTPIGVASVSHLLTGFVGKAVTNGWARQLRGADLIAYFRVAS